MCKYRDVYCSLFIPTGGGLGIISIHLGIFSSWTGGKKRKKVNKAEKGVK